jgi:N-acetylneuraminic acid mutarotase
MLYARSGYTATLLPDGKVLIAGDDWSGPSKAAQVYDPAARTWALTGSMSTGRSAHTAALLPNEKVLVVGGYGNHSMTAEVYDPATGTWSDTSFMASKRYGHTATLLSNGKVLISGGETGSSAGFLSSAELYTP